jgi:predicted nucleic acid-binding protein
MPAEFLDTNVILYSLSDDPRKQDIALTLLARKPVVSVQVLSEAANIMRKKLGFDVRAVMAVVERVADECASIQPVTMNTLRDGLDIASRYSLSHYDSLILAAALEAGCSDVYSEDMQHGQQINSRLTIINPFG